MFCPQIRAAIRLYAACGMPAECKLTLLRGERRRVAHAKDIVHCIFNILDETPGDFGLRMNSYTFCMQREYYFQLHASGLCPAWGLWDTNGNREGDVATIISLAKLLHEYDGTTFEFEDVLVEAPSRTLRFDVDAESLKRNLSQAQRAYHDYEDLVRICSRTTTKIAIRADVLTSELMAFYAHFSRAYLRYLKGIIHPDLVEADHPPSKDIDAGVLHLKRAILDIRKGIILTAALQRPEFLRDGSLLRQLLAERQREIMMPPTHSSKTSLYMGEAETLLQAFRTLPAV